MRRAASLLFVLGLVLVSCGPGTPPHVSVDPALASLAPEDSVMLLGARVDKLRETPFYEKYVKSGQVTGLNDFTEKTGASPEDLWEVLAASNGAAMVVMARGKFSERGLEPRLKWEGSERTSYSGYTVVSDGRGAVTFVNATTAVAGPVERVHSVIDQRGEDHRPPEKLLGLIESVDRSNQVWAVATGGFKMPEGPGRGAAGNINQVLGKLTSLKVMANLSDGLVLSALGECSSPEDAETLQSALRAFVGLARLSARNKPALIGVCDTLQIGRQGKLVTIDSTVPAALLDQFIAESTRPR